MKKLSSQIRDSFGTLKRFARLNNISYGGLRVFICNGTPNKRIEQALIKNGFLQKSKRFKNE